MINFEIFDSHLESILVLDESEVVIYCNEAFATLVELSRRRILKKIKFSDLISFTHATDGFTLSEVQDSTPYKEAVVKTSTDKEVRIQYTMQRLGADPQWLVFFKDVTLEERLQGKYRAELEQKEGVIVELEKAKAQLEDYSRNLEKKVEERTFEISQLNRQMKALLDSLSQGFLMFGRDGVCQQVYSRACEDLFKIAPPQKTVWDVFNLDSKKSESFKKWMMTVFSEMLPFEDLAPLGPQRLEVNEGGKTIALEYFPLRNDSGIEFVVVVATDITSLLSAQNEAKVEKEKVHFVLNLIQKKRQFSSFIEETERLLLSAQNLVQKNPWTEVDRSEMLRFLHTVKGSAALYSLAGVPDLCHETEELVKTLPLPLSVPHRSEVSEELHQLERRIQEIKNQATSILGQKLFSKEKWFEISSEQVQRWIDILKSAHPHSSSPLEKELNQLWLESGEHFFRPYADEIQSLAERLGKKMLPLEINDHGCYLPPEELNEIFSSYVHVFRNSMDHGIETPEERLSAGKPEAGKISVDLKLLSRGSQNELEILVQDDGRGISVDKLRKKLISKKPEQKENFEKLSDNDLIQYIFEDDVSTRDQVTDLSGRGVGLNALKFAIEARGGTIVASTTPGKGTQILARIPIHLGLTQINPDKKSAA